MATFTAHFAAAAVCLPGIHTTREWLIFTVHLNHESFSTSRIIYCRNTKKLKRVSEKHIFYRGQEGAPLRSGAPS